MSVSDAPNSTFVAAGQQHDSPPIVTSGAAGRPCEKPRAVDDVGLAAHDRRRQARRAAADRARGRRPESRRSVPRARVEAEPDRAALSAHFASAWMTVTGELGSDGRGGPASTSRVPSVEPSLTTRISRATGRSIAQQAIDDRANGANFVVDGNDDREQLGP